MGKLKKKPDAGLQDHLSAEAEAVQDEPQTEPAGPEQETSEQDEPLTPEEEAQIDAFIELSDRLDDVLDRFEEAMDLLGEGIADLLAGAYAQARSRES